MNDDSLTLSLRYDAEVAKRDAAEEFDEQFVLCFELKALERARDDAEDEFERLKKSYTELERRFLDYMSVKGVELVRYDELGRFSPDYQIFPKVEDEDALWSWLRTNGHGDVIKTVTSVHPSTLRGMNNKHEEANGCPLPGCSSYVKTKISIKK